MGMSTGMAMSVTRQGWRALCTGVRARQLVRQVTATAAGVPRCKNLHLAHTLRVPSKTAFGIERQINTRIHLTPTSKPLCVRLSPRTSVTCFTCRRRCSTPELGGTWLCPLQSVCPLLTMYFAHDLVRFDNVWVCWRCMFQRQPLSLMAYDMHMRMR
jgi:hypothetical protein